MELNTLSWVPQKLILIRYHNNWWHSRALAAVFSFARELELAKCRPSRCSKEMARIKRRIAMAKSKRAVHGGEKMCVQGYLDVSIVRCYRRHNIISSVKILEFAWDWSDEEAQGKGGTWRKTEMEDGAHFMSRCVEELRRDERKEKRLINCRILVCD